MSAQSVIHMHSSGEGGGVDSILVLFMGVTAPQPRDLRQSWTLAGTRILIGVPKS